MHVNLRQVEPKDFAAIEHAVKEFSWEKVNPIWDKLVDRTKVINALQGKTNLQSLIVEEKYLLLLNPSKPWYSNKTILQELLILNLYPNHKVSIYCIPNALKQIASVWEFNGVATGAVLSNKANKLIKLYERARFKVQAPTMYWENKRNCP